MSEMSPRRARGTVGLLRLMALLLLALLPAACAAASAAPEPEATDEVNRDDTAEYTVGLLLSSLYNPLYVSLQKGAIESASRLDIELIVREASNNADRQLQQVDELLALGVDALVLNPVDSAALSPGVRAAGIAGVPVITVERRVNGAAVRAHVAPDNITGGEMAASYLVEMLQGKGKVVELMGITGTSAAQDRSTGFHRVLASHQGMILEAREAANFDRREAKRVFARILETTPDVKAVFAHNDAMILGAIEAAEEAGRAGEIVFIGFDGVAEAIEALDSGALSATIAQQPIEMGRIAIELTAGALRGEPIEQNVAVDLALVTR